MSFRRHSLTFLLFATALFAQDPAKAPDKQDKEVAEKLTLLKKAVADKKRERDAEGIQVIDHLLTKLNAGMHDKDKQAFVKGLDDVLFSGRLRDPESTSLYVAAAAALGQCGQEGAKVLHKAIKDERFPNKPAWISMREQFVKNLGKTHDESMVDFLCDMARTNPQDAMMGAAGEALGNFEDSKDALRKKIVGDLLVRYGELDQLASVLDSGNIAAQNARNTMAVISEKWNTTLSKLTRQDFRKFTEWNAWYNKNKGSAWK
ncbi:MAG: HEAT repeat domain-containing protein [Planctomycetes bacterium]|nr:HEAT repeat domain-containing protein [Planctomycetota bacterium]